MNFKYLFSYLGTQWYMILYIILMFVYPEYSPALTLAFVALTIFTLSTFNPENSFDDIFLDNMFDICRYLKHFLFSPMRLAIVTVAVIAALYAGSYTVYGLIVIFVITYLLYRTQRDTTTKQASKTKFYESKGLNKRDIAFFRETMADAKAQIVAIELAANQYTKLTAVDNRYQLVSVLKQFFKRITQNPDKIHHVNVFLYKSLPQLNERVADYVSLQKLVVKNKQHYQEMNTAVEDIEQLSDQIRQQFIQFSED